MAGPWDPTFLPQENPDAQKAVENLYGALNQPLPSPTAASQPPAEDAAIDGVIRFINRAKTELPTGMTPAQAAERKAQLEAATKTDWMKPAIATGALLLLHALGGKRGSAAVGRNMRTWTEGMAKGNEERINENVAGLKTQWAGQDAERKSNADMLKSVVGPIGSELMKERIQKPEKMPKEWQLFQLAQGNSDFAEWLRKQHPDSTKALSSDQLMASYIYDAVGRGVLTREQALEQLGKIKAGYMPELLTAAGMNGVSAPFAGLGKNKKVLPSLVGP